MNATPEGQIKIRLARGPEGVEATIVSSRMFAASRWFEGKTVSETLRLLPVLFRVCSSAQAFAAVAAVENARAVEVDAAVTSTREMIVLAETFREHLLRIFTTWHDPALDPALTTPLSDIMRLPLRLGNALYAARDAFAPGGGRLTRDDAAVRGWLDDAAGLLHDVVLGCPAGDWLAMCSVAEARDWAASATGIAPGFIRRILERDLAEKGANGVEPLPVLAPEELAARIDSETGHGFLAAPSWQGEVFETGAFARVRLHPLVRDASRMYGNGLMAHSLARLAELTGIPEQMARLYTFRDHFRQEDIEVRRVGLGIGQVEAARGRLVHRVTLDGERVTTYRMLAPTEWNFHPRGVVYQALISLDPGDDLVRLGSLLVEAVDPCVGYDLEVAGDA